VTAFYFIRRDQRLAALVELLWHTGKKVEINIDSSHGTDQGSMSCIIIDREQFNTVQVGARLRHRKVTSNSESRNRTRTIDEPLPCCKRHDVMKKIGGDDCQPFMSSVETLHVVGMPGHRAGSSLSSVKRGSRPLCRSSGSGVSCLRMN
jgi:hypothetical protein